MSAFTAFLRNVPVLAGLDDESLERLAGQVRGVHVRAGDWIMRQGDAELGRRAARDALAANPEVAGRLGLG